MRRLAFAIASLFAAAVPAAAQEKKDVIRVACVGDSITYGSRITDRAKNSYPAVLQTLLGDGYEVKNFGVSARTLLNKGDYPYTKEKAYQEALAFKPNVVVIKLGTNDTKPQNWKFADEFEADYKKLIESFRGLESKPKVFLCTPVPAFPGGGGIAEERIKDGVKPKVEALGKTLDLKVIDLYAALSGKSELFPDKIHPDAAGAKLMAEAVAAAVSGRAKPPAERIEPVPQ